MSYGLTPEGFIPKRLETIKAEYEEAYRAAFGVGIDLEASSVFGQTIGIASEREADLWEVLELIYLSQSPASAEYVQLDNVAAYTGIERLPATKSTLTAVMYTEAIGSLPVTVPALTQGAVASSGSVFELVQDTDITLNELLDANLEVGTAVDGATYRVTINGTDEEKVANGADTPESIVSALVDEINTGAENAHVEATDNGGGQFNIRAKLEDGVRNTYTLAINVSGGGATGDEMEVSEAGSPGVFSAVETGAVVAPVGMFTEIVTPVTDLDRLYNLGAASIGTEVETDAAFRQRRVESLQVSGAATLAAIRARILDNVSGVEACSIYENDTMIDNTGTGGLPPKSFECVVSGGAGDPAVEQAIAEEIWAAKPAGIQSYGSVTKQVTDTNGDLQDVSFSHPTPMYAHVNIEFEPYNEEEYPGATEAIAGITASVLEYGQTFRIGQDMIRDRFYAAVYNSGVAGIGSVPTLEIALTANPGDPPSWGTGDIAVAPDEVALFAESRITVVEV